jgi:molecular chaperone HtpG
MAAQAKKYDFQSENKQILEIMINSLYTNKEIFLRELISNSSDAIDRLRFEALTNPELIGTDKFEIRLAMDEQAKTLTITDNGIGMSREEVIANIGTIAKSGTRELRERIKQGETPQMLAEFIGQFGVGFYSAFMVADKVVMVTRRAGETAATQWESTGDGTYTISDADNPGRSGTSITLYLKPANGATGLEDYTNPWTLSRIVRRYSDFVSYPIICTFLEEKFEPDEAGKPDKRVTVLEERTLNSMKPIWTRPQSEVSDEEYNDFYKHISHDWAEPFKTLALKAEGVTEYQSLLFIPSKAPHDLFYHAFQGGLCLYAKRVMIMERCEDLLPRYLRFVKGVVDSADLPLNISRQMLQQDRHISQIRKWITKKALELLRDLMEKEYDRYLQFWKEFGRALKEGVGSDHENKEKILELLLFESSNDPQKLTTLKEYTSRMKSSQKEIFYLTGESRSVVENSPHLEALNKNGIEVLYLTEPVDELLAQSLMDYEGKRLKSAAKGAINLGTTEERQEAERELKEVEEKSSGLLDHIQKRLDSHVKQVRLTNRLVSSPVCLVGTEIDYSPQMERLLHMGQGNNPRQRRIMELNPKHEVFEKMLYRYLSNADDQTLNNYAELLLGYALIAEGSGLHDPVRFNSLVMDLIAENLCIACSGHETGADRTSYT